MTAPHPPCVICGAQVERRRGSAEEWVEGKKDYYKRATCSRECLRRLKSQRVTAGWQKRNRERRAKIDAASRVVASRNLRGSGPEPAWDFRGRDVAARDGGFLRLQPEPAGTVAGVVGPL